MTTKIIYADANGKEVKIKYRNKFLKKGGLENTPHEYYSIINNTEIINVKTKDIFKLLQPFILQYKRKKIGLFNEYYIFDYDILRLVANGVTAE